MSRSDEKAMNWLTAALLSLALHVAVLALLLGPKGCACAEKEPMGKGQPPVASDVAEPSAPMAPPLSAGQPAQRQPSSVGSMPPPAAPSWVDRVSLEGASSSLESRKTAEAESSESRERPQPSRSVVESETPPSPHKGSETSPRVVDRPAASKIYVVKRGDNLTRIAEKDGSTFDELAKLNGTSVKKLKNLRVGQKLKLKNGID